MPKKVESKLFKNAIDRKAITKLGVALHSSWPNFPLDNFIKTATCGLDELELKARVNHIIQAMTQHLPDDYPAALTVVHNARSHWPKDKTDNSFDGFAAWPLVDWVGENGVDHPKLSLTTLRNLTGLFSAEFAVRPFLLQHTGLTLEILNEWIEDDDHHVRRWISEGTRPRLPWGKQLPTFMKNPDPVIQLLEKLKDDDSEYVRRSVANNLNDIAKDHPDLVAEVSTKWMKDSSLNRQRLVKHGLRTLIKQGHPGALKALGYEVNPQVKVDFLINSKTITMGENLGFQASIKSTARTSQKLVVDFAVHYRKANDSLSPKIFKWKVLEIEPGQTIELTKQHRFVSRSVRKLYPGPHKIEILLAGIGFGTCRFVVSS